MKQIENIPDSLKSANTVITLGNSGSLLDTPPQAFWDYDKSNTVVIGVNRICREGLDLRRYYPDILIISDIKVFNTDAELISQLSKDVYVVIPKWLANESLVKSVDVYKNLYIMPVHYVNRESCGGSALQNKINREELPSKFGQPFSTIANVFFYAVQMACVIAKERVLLLGAEGKWPYKHDPRFQTHHFFENNNDPVLSNNNQTQNLKQEYNSQWHRLRGYYKWLKPNLKILDLSPWSDLSIMGFDKGDISELHK